ncbi:MAG: hydroxymethylglutaryl-CoA lyase [Candidatus Melainabacteria bacterium]
MSGTFVRLVEVGPRDGLQNEKTHIPAERKIELINRLNATGLKDIEISAFVNPRAVPQMADAAEVCAGIEREPDIRYWVLVPNMQGLEAAIAANIRHIAVFTAASDAFNLKNIRKTIAESIDVFRPVVHHAKAEGLTVRGYISTAFHCPELLKADRTGKIAPEVVLPVCRDLLAIGCDELSIGDTIGRATPEDTESALKLWTQELPVDKLAMHFHDTFGHALDNIRVSLTHGIRTFDASVGGLGGCPYAEGATGNVASESVVRLLHSMGYETGIDENKLAEAGRFIRGVLIQ